MRRDKPGRDRPEVEKKRCSETKIFLSVDSETSAQMVESNSLGGGNDEARPEEHNLHQSQPLRSTLQLNADNTLFNHNRFNSL